MKTKITSLNNVYPEFSIEEIEQRLETDPLTLGGLVNLVEDPNEPDPRACINATSCLCNKHEGSCIGFSSCAIDL